ncbi:hypothetical protein D3C75_1055110 [compost metagenome]
MPCRSGAKGPKLHISPFAQPVVLIEADEGDQLPVFLNECLLMHPGQQPPQRKKSQWTGNRQDQNGNKQIIDGKGHGPQEVPCRLNKHIDQGRRIAEQCDFACGNGEAAVM